MKEMETKKIISEEILNTMNDQSAADVLRDILFSDYNVIDWNKAFESIQRHMPELKTFEQDLENAGLNVIDMSIDNTMRNIRVKIEQLVEDFENSIGNRNMSDLEQGKYDGYRDILDLLDDLN